MEGQPEQTVSVMQCLARSTSQTGEHYLQPENSPCQEMVMVVHVINKKQSMRIKNNQVTVASFDSNNPWCCGLMARWLLQKKCQRAVEDAQRRTALLYDQLR